MSTPWTPPGEDLPEPSAHQPAVPAPLSASPYGPPPAYAPQPPYPGGPHPDGIPPSRTMAGWSLGLAIFGCSLITWVLAVVFAIQVLTRSSRERRDHGRGLAIAALVIAGLWLVLLGLSVVSYLVSAPEEQAGSPDDERVTDSRTGEELPRVMPSKLRLGDCFDDSALSGLEADGNTVVSDLATVVPCERLHDFEVYAIRTIESADFPGEDAVQVMASEGCARAFKPYVGEAYGPSDLDFWLYYPTKRSWELLDDKQFTCVVGEPGTKTVGSLEGTKR